MRQAAIRAVNRGVENVRMSVIDAPTAGGPDGKSYFHVPAYHKELKDRRAFDNGAWYYHGTVILTLT